MNITDKTKEQLRKEVDQLKDRISELEKSETGYKKAEQAFKYNEEKLREMTEFLPGVVYECDAQGNLNFVNRVAFKTFGYTREDFDKGVNALQFIAINDRKRAGENIEEVLRGIDNGPFEYIARRKDNSEFPIVVYLSPIIRNGKPVGIKGIIMDITESKQVEKKFIQKNEQLELVMQGANIGWWDWDIPSGKEIYNEILPELLGYKSNEIEPNIDWWKDKIHPDDSKQVGIDLQEHFDGKTEFYINEHRLKTRTGKWKWFFDHGKVVSRDKYGKPIRMIGTIRDIDNQQRAEEALQESEKHLQALIDAMPDFVCFKDGDGHWLKVNDATIRSFRLEGIDYRGKKDSELADLNSPLRNTFLTCKETDAKAWKDDGLFNGEEMISHPDGTVRIYDVTKVAVFQSSGERKGLVVLGHDITERKKAESELQERINELEAFYRATLGREGRVIELKQEVNELLEQLGKNKKYANS